jgi:lysozyme
MNFYDKISTQLIRHEGKRNDPYVDSKGKITIGIGRNLTDKKISDVEIYFLFHRDLTDAINDAESVFPNLSTFTMNRQIAIIDMCFNLGLGRFKTFEKMIEAIKNNDWEKAANEALNSKWAREDVGKERSFLISQELREG